MLKEDSLNEQLIAVTNGDSGLENVSISAAAD